jgi:hypothetical protein
MAAPCDPVAPCAAGVTASSNSLAPICTNEHDHICRICIPLPTLPPPPVAVSDAEPRPNWSLMRAARAHLLTAATLDSSAPPTIRKVETVGFAVPQAVLPRVGSRVVCIIRTHARTHAHQGSRVHEGRAHRRTELRSSGCPHLRQDWAHPTPSALEVNAATTVHLQRDCAASLAPSLRSCPATSAPERGSPTAHICNGT